MCKNISKRKNKQEKEKVLGLTIPIFHLFILSTKANLVQW